MLSKQKIKYIQSLGQKKFREEDGTFIAEGPKLIKDLLHTNPSSIKEILATEDWVTETAIPGLDERVTIVSPGELERVSQLKTANKVLAIVNQYDPGEIALENSSVTMALDTIQDPGNFGTIIRIADWFGIKYIVASPDSADLYNPKVVQASMGSIARVKVFYKDLAEWMSGLTEIAIFATGLEGRDIDSIEKIKQGIIIIGNESKGISPDVMQYATSKITIPRKGAAESLNAAVATGIILSHLI